VPTRAGAVAALAAVRFDVPVIGGGITGAGVALEAPAFRVEAAAEGVVVDVAVGQPGA
jgi:hypothetical protein